MSGRTAVKEDTSFLVPTVVGGTAYGALVGSTAGAKVWRGALSGGAITAGLYGAGVGLAKLKKKNQMKKEAGLGDLFRKAKSWRETRRAAHAARRAEVEKFINEQVKARNNAIAKGKSANTLETLALLGGGAAIGAAGMGIYSAHQKNKLLNQIYGPPQLQ